MMCGAAAATLWLWGHRLAFPVWLQFFTWMDCVNFPHLHHCMSWALAGEGCMSLRRPRFLPTMHVDGTTHPWSLETCSSSKSSRCLGRSLPQPSMGISHCTFGTSMPIWGEVRAHLGPLWSFQPKTSRETKHVSGMHCFPCKAPRGGINIPSDFSLARRRDWGSSIT